MRALLLALALLLFTQGAHAERREPFGVALQAVPGPQFIGRQAGLIEWHKELIASIATEVRQEPDKAKWLTHVNRLVNLSPIGECEQKAIIKIAVLRKLGYERQDLRYVVGSEDGAKDWHAVVAVNTPEGGWEVLDIGHLTPRHRVQPETVIAQIKRFHPLFAIE